MGLRWRAEMTSNQRLQATRSSVVLALLAPPPPPEACHVRAHYNQSGGNNMIGPNSDTVFSGSIPKLYEKYLVPMIFEDYARTSLSD